MRRIGAGNMELRRHGMAMTAALLVSAIPWSAAHAQTAQADLEDANDNETIMVQGERDLETPELRRALRDVAMRGRDYLTPLAQYQTPLCPRVIGLGERMGAYVTARVRRNARDAGAEVADEDCEANAVVIVTDDPDLLIEKMRKSNPELFDPAANRRIKRAQNLGDAAIVWSRSVAQSPAGRNGGVSDVVAGNSLDGAFANAGGLPQERRLSFPSRFAVTYSIEKLFTTIVFDVDRLDGAHLDQVSDFATLRILGSPQPAINIEQDGAVSLLNLFDVGPAAAPLRMTALDRAYLKGLYAMRPNDPSTRLEHFVKLAYRDMTGAEPCDPGKPCAAVSPKAASAADQP